MKTQRAAVVVVALGLLGLTGAFLGSELRESRDASPGGRAPSAAPFGLHALAPGTPSAGSGETRVADTGAAASSSGTDPARSPAPAAPLSSAAASAPSPPPGPGSARMPAPAAPGLPGGFQLYTGQLRRRVAPGTVVPGSEDAKLAQLERAQDVASKRGTVVGRLDHVDAKAISGWAYAWDDPSSPVAVSIFVDGTLAGTVAADQPRPGFAPDDPSNPLNSRGWTCPAPASLADGDKHVVEALGRKEGSEALHALEGSPHAFGGVPFPQGQLAWASARLVYGWAQDPAQASAPVTVTVVGDGTTLGKVSTLGPGHNGEVFVKALSLEPSRKLTVPLAGVSGPDDPTLPAALQAKAQALSAESHYRELKPLAAAQADPTLAFDELDFFGADPQGNAVALPGKELAGIKFSRLNDDVQAFVLAVPQAAAPPGWLQARGSSADGSMDRELSGSPVQLGASTNRLPQGAVSFVNAAQISGWATDPDTMPAPCSVDVFVDGTYVQRIPADKKFDALAFLGALPDPYHAFTFVPPDRYKDGKTHRVQFFGVNQPEGVNPELPGSPTTFVGQRDAAPFGFLDGVSVDQATGWAYDPDAGAAPTTVEVWVDDVLWKSVPADAVRTDLVPIVTAEPQHGFVVPLPGTLKDGKLHTVRAFAVDFPGGGPKQELSRSPQELNAQAPLFGIWPIDSSTGVQITGVLPGSNAAQAGIVAGDLIRSFDGYTQKVDVSAFVAWARTKSVGEQVVFRMWNAATTPAQTAASPPPPAGTPPLGPGERIVVVTVGSR